MDGPLSEIMIEGICGYLLPPAAVELVSDSPIV